MEINSKYFFLALLVFSSFTLSRPVLIDSTYTWYYEIKGIEQRFEKIQVIDYDCGFCISSGKDPTIPGRQYEYKNDQWQSIRSYPQSISPNIILFKQKGEVYLWTVHRSTGTGNSTIDFYNGRNWMEQYIQDPYLKNPIISQEMYVHGYNPQNIWLIGDSGDSYNFNGTTWLVKDSVLISSTLDKNDKQKISGVYVPNSSEVWVCTDKASIFHFIRNKWEIDTVFTKLVESEIRDICFYNNKGWAVAQNGYILEYQNRRWNIEQLNPEWDFNSIKVFSDSDIFIAGNHDNQSVLLHKKNDKLISYQSLQQLIPGKINDIDGFYFASENRYKLWICADNGLATNTLRSGISFSDVTSKFNLPSSARGGLFIDLDNDLDTDVLLLADIQSPYRIYINDKAGGYINLNLFEEHRASAFLSAATMGDIDNDNKVDIVLVNHEGKLELFRQRRTLKFESQILDILTIPEDVLVTLRFCDFNLDGYVDLFVAGAKLGFYCLINDGYGQFTEKISINIPINNDSGLISVTPYDVNADGFFDIYLVYQSKENELWLNNGKWDFIQKDDELYIKIKGKHNYVAIFQDFNCDRWPDLFLYDNILSGQIKLNKKFLTGTESQTINLFSGITHLSVDNGIIAAGDINHDYYPDIYVSEKLFINDCGYRFIDPYFKSDVNFEGNPCFMDFDDDNDLDIYVSRKAEDLNDSGVRAKLLQNNLENRYALKFRFDCLKNNRLGIGSWIWVYKTDGENIARSKYCGCKFIGFEGSPLLQENFLPITIPVDEDVDYSVIVRFPDGTTQTYSRIKPNELFIINDLPILLRIHARIQKMIRLSLYHSNWFVEIVKFFFILLSLFWLLFKYEYINKVRWIIKIIIFFMVILCYSLYFVIEGNSPYDFTHWLFFAFFPLLTIFFPMLIHFIIKIRHFESIDHYRILKFLGEGGMGKVYKAKDLTNNKLFAIKVLHASVTFDEEGKKRFKLIEKLSKQLKHENIVRISRTGIWRNQSYFVMEFLKGKTLSQIIDKKKIFSIKEIISISLQIAYALKEIHKKNIVHRDVKSDNIFISDHNVVKLMDFDLAGPEKAGSEIESEAFLGTLSYMSPQQAVGESIDHRSDIYSLGVIMYEMATGRLPFLANCLNSFKSG